MDKSYILGKLEKNDTDHEKLVLKIDTLKDEMTKNHIALLSAINENKVDVAMLKTKSAGIGLIAGAIIPIADAINKYFKG